MGEAGGVVLAGVATLRAAQADIQRGVGGRARAVGVRVGNLDIVEGRAVDTDWLVLLQWVKSTIEGKW